jgi:acylphosphatase
MIKHFDIKIIGRVQGVAFRFGAAEAAKENNICGFASNEDDGSVHIEAEGEEENLARFLLWCKKGTSWSKVEKVEANESKIQNYSGFEAL